MDLSGASDEELARALAERAEKRVAAALEQKSRAYAAKFPPIGWWEVTTALGEDARGDRSLGVFYGHVADIAALLYPMACYGLSFKPYRPEPAAAAARTIRVTIDAPALREEGLHNLLAAEMAAFLSLWLGAQAPKGAKVLECGGATGSHVTLGLLTGQAVYPKPASTP